jgi:hypothetical protein
MRRAILLIAALAVTQSACFGSFAATRALYKFNKGVSQDKWLQWLAFLGLTILPAYWLFAVGDTLIFNSIEFWGGSNPINADITTPRFRDVMLADGTTARLIEDENGRRIEHADWVLHFVVDADGFALVDQDGKVVSSVREGENGAVITTDAEGNELIVRADELAAAGNTPESVTAWTLARAAN